MPAAGRLAKQLALSLRRNVAAGSAFLSGIGPFEDARQAKVEHLGDDLRAAALLNDALCCVAHAQQYFRLSKVSQLLFWLFTFDLRDCIDFRNSK